MLALSLYLGRMRKTQACSMQLPVRMVGQGCLRGRCCAGEMKQAARIFLFLSDIFCHGRVSLSRSDVNNTLCGSVLGVYGRIIESFAPMCW